MNGSGLSARLAPRSCSVPERVVWGCLGGVSLYTREIRKQDVVAAALGARECAEQTVRDKPVCGHLATVPPAGLGDRAPDKRAIVRGGALPHSCHPGLLAQLGGWAPTARLQLPGVGVEGSGEDSALMACGCF